MKRRAISARRLGSAIHQTYDIGGEMWSPAVADLDGDAHPDRAAADVENGMLKLLFNIGGGALDEVIEIATGDAALSVAAVDLDGDAHIDLAVGHAHTDEHIGKLCVLLNNSDGTFNTPADHATGYESHWVSADDLDGDRDLDPSIPLPIGRDRVSAALSTSQRGMERCSQVGS